MPDTAPLDALAVDFRLNPETNDLELTNGEATAVSGLDAIAQLCRIALGLWRGEWFWNPAEGLPMLDKVMGRGVPLDDIKAVFNRALLAVPGVQSVTALQVVRDNATRNLQVIFTAKTRAGVLASTDYQPFIVAA